MLHQYLIEYGYAALFVVVMLESLGIPGPGQTLIIAAALLASEGRLNIVFVVIAAWIAGTLGGCIGYWIGRRGGHALILRFGKFLHIGEPRLQRLEARFARYGFWFVLVARFLEVLRQLQGIIAGTVEMPFRRFFAANLLGALLWAAAWGLGAWKLGHQIKKYDYFLEKGSTALVAVVIAVMLVLFGIYLYHQRRGRPHRGA